MRHSKSKLAVGALIAAVLGLSALAPAEQDKQMSLAAFDTILKVLKSPRCMNCHPSNDQPRQGDDEHAHLFQVVRGTASLVSVEDVDNGGPVQTCNTCHHEENNPYSGVPGAPHWAIAPETMGWMGLTDAQIGQTLMNRQLNGGRSPADLVKHMSEDQLVLWAWDPGADREPPPVPLDEFRLALTDWLENGAHVPEENIQ